jgi:hypothetical protein
MMQKSFANLPLVPVLAAAAVMIIGCIAIGGIMAYVFLVPASTVADSPDGSSGQTEVAISSLSFPTATFIPTHTPTPTSTVTATPTNTPTSTPTSTAIPPTRIPSTRVPSTNTAIPPTDVPPPTPVPGRGMIDNVRFSVQKTDYNTTTWIIFNFSVHNAYQGDWYSGCLGVDILNSSYQPFMLQCSWGAAGPLHFTYNGGLDWEDHIAQISIPGTYYFYLIICYLPSIADCNNSSTDWEHIAGPITVVIH